MKIAVACNHEDHVGHFEFCGSFGVYDFGDDYSNPRNKALVSTEGRQGSEALTELMKELDVSMVLCDGMGPAARNGLLQLGVLPVTGYRGDVERGAIDLMMGNVPITQSACDSCGGDCASGKCHNG